MDSTVLALTPAERLEAISKGFSPDAASTGKTLLGLALLLLGIAGVFLLALALHRRISRQRLPHRRPYRLLWDLTGHLGLPLRHRLLLLLIARKVGLHNPTVMVLSPALFELYTAEWLSRSLVPTLMLDPRTTLSAISARLFADMPSAAGDVGSSATQEIA